MRTLSDADFLRLWERGARRHPLDRALLMLAAALPETPYEKLADWPIGRRNQTLVRFHRQSMGATVLRAWTACAACGEKLEFDLNTQMLAEGETELPAEARVTAKEWIFRLPNSRDLARAAREADAARGAVRIAESCLLSANAPEKWEEEDLSMIGEKLALADPLAEMQMALECPECGHQWEEAMDLVSFFWNEIEARARRILRAVHTLASAYGWSEADILSMSENRRATYLEMVRS